MLRSIHIRVSQLRALSLSSSERRQTSLKELSSLVEAICARDCALAENLERLSLSLNRQGLPKLCFV
ncbi:hypothetical protein SAMN05443999_12026 [Roseovarius azorensis]|uniref:Uncharacterized protein n=2 Tax=Roseovarius azorensis TaxID=1287727 RepID=A0A1H7XFE5_9RHOB|nr:hypothetical protein SAMN05443999_12026 [Roseovarius azorensis]